MHYLKGNRSDEASTHLNKAKKILENSGNFDTLEYASVLIKIGLLNLNQNDVGMCLIETKKGL